MTERQSNDSAQPGPDAQRGLTAAEASARLAAHGYNELPGHAPRTPFAILGEVLREPMFLLLLGAAAIYFLIGDRREALVLLGSIGIVIAITVVQERRTERTLATLRELSSPRALVLRDGVEQRIAGREVVIDDVVLIREGDRVPADGRVLTATGLAVDESILTGESLPVDKEALVTTGAMLAADARSHLYSGTLVVSGYAAMLVTATGRHAEIGRIGEALAALSPETTPLFTEVRRIVRWLAAGGLLLCAIIAVAFATLRADWLGGILAGITVAMGVLPEEFPVVLTIFLAMGAWRISRQGVLTRRMPAIETMGSVTVLAVDKTGTLTENRMRVAVLDSGTHCVDLRGGGAEWSDDAATILGVATAASERDAFDPMERAIHEAAAARPVPLAAHLASQQLVREYDLTPALLAVTHVWLEPQTGIRHVAVKGAPETVFRLCRLDDARREALLADVHRHAAQGLRVLGVARGVATAGELPDTPAGFTLDYLGLLCLADPVRDNVPAALADCQAAGIRVVMITGDHPGTALAIGAQAGFATDGGVLTGADIESLPDSELRQRVAGTCLYARTTPQHKLRLIEALKANGDIVAMTGDGVNDAPALKAAHVGVAMGSRGTDVAREAAALVLVNDDFVSLVRAIRLGRRIYDNIQHAMIYLLAVHMPIAGLGLLPVLLGWPLLLFPLHVLFLEFIIDPACSLVFEADPENRDVMRRPPRPPQARLFSRHTVRQSLYMGFIALLFCTGVYAVALPRLPEPEARALTFVALVIVNLLMIFVARSQGDALSQTLRRANRIFWWITAATLVALAAVVGLPAPADLFAFGTPPPGAVVLVGTTAFVTMLAAARLGPHQRQVSQT